METESHLPAFDELLAHAGWVRALARSLVADAGDADDVVQETWVAALEHPPVRDENLRGWFATVVRNAARMRGRGAGRRVARETSLARERAEAVPSSAELAERVDTQRRLSQRVLELDEPYRSTVVLRFYEGLSAAEIARQTGVPAGTVRWRLSVALEELRARLDEDFGGRRAAWVALVLPLARRDVAVGASTAGGAAGVATLLPGILAMKLGLKLTLVAVLAALTFFLTPVGPLALGFFGRSEPLDRTPVEVTFRPLEPETLVAPREPDAERRVVQIDAQAAAVIAANATGLRLRVVEPDGTPVAGAAVSLLGDRSGAVRSDADGAVLLLFGERRLEDWRNALSIHHPEFATRSVRVRPEPGRVVELGDLVLEPAGSVEGRVVTADGRPARGAWVEPSEREPSTEHEYREERVRRSAGGSNTPVADELGRFRLEGVAVGEVRLWAGLDGELAALTNPIEVRRGMTSAGVEIVLGEPRPEDFITGEVLLPDGGPAAGARVNSRYSSFGVGSGNARFMAQQDGSFRIAYLPASPVTLRVQDRDGLFAMLSVEAARGGEHLVLHLVENEHLELSLSGDGRPIEAPRIVAMDPARMELLVPGSRVQPHAGRYRIPIPREPFQVEILVEGYERAVLGPFDGLAAPRSLDVALHALPGLRGVVTADGAPVAGAKVELYRTTPERTLHNGFLVRVEPHAEAEAETTDDGTFDLTFRKEGEFFIRVSHDQYAPAELGPRSLDPVPGLAGLVVEMGSGGAIEGRVHVPAGSPAGRIVAVSRGDGHARTTRSDAEGAFRFERLLPGRWQVELTDEERIPGYSTTRSDGAPFRETELPWNCVVREGETTRFDLGEPTAVVTEFAGTLTIDGAGARGWIATLVPIELEHAIVDVPRVTLDDGGAFTLEVDSPGQYRLSILEPGAGLQLVTTVVTLSGGRLDWSAAFDTGELLLTGPAEPAAEAFDVLIAERDGFVFLNRLQPEGDGPLRLRGLPAGPCRVMRQGPEALSGPGLFDGGETRLHAVIVAGDVVEGAY